MMHYRPTSPQHAVGINTERSLIVPDEFRHEVDVLKELTRYFVIDHPALKTQQHGQRWVVGDLFKIYLGASKMRENDEDRRDAWDVLPEDLKTRLRGIRSDEHARNKAEKQTELVRMVADLIASMTVRQLLVTHRRLTGSELGSVSDLVY